VKKTAGRNLTIFILCALVLLWPAGTAGSAYGETGDSFPAENETNIELQQTEVTGITTAYKAKKGTILTDVITVSPALGRTVELQRYDKILAQWQTMAEFSSEDTQTARVTITYPPEWHEKTWSQWRIYLPEEEITDPDDPEVVTGTLSSFESSAINITATQIKDLSLYGKGAVIMCVDTGEMLYEKSAKKKLYNASTTKIMSAIIAIERKSMNSKVRISKKVTRTPYRELFMKRKDRFYLRDMLYAMLITSSNDASVAVAEKVGGSVKGFAKLMNKRAKSLGCVKTHFMNPHGLYSKKHYSCAYDLALMTKQAIKYSTFLKAVGKKSYKFKNTKKTRKYKVRTGNSLLGKYQGVIGGKTGYTGPAGYCFVSIFKYQGKTYITVTLGSKTGSKRWTDTKRMLSYIKTYCK
jgi:hypothetical protein